MLSPPALEDQGSAVAAMLGHELRTPLTTIHGGLVLLDEHDERLSDGQRAELMDAVRRETEHLIRLVDDLVVIVDPPDLQAVARPILLQRELPSLLADRDVDRTVVLTMSLDHDTPPVAGDGDALRQILRGLIAALTADATLAGDASPRSRIAIRVTGTGDERAVVRLTLMDGPPPSAMRAGTRLSLAASRLLLDRMGGDLRARRSARGRLQLEVGLPAVVEPDR